MVCFGQATLTKGRFRAQALVHSSASSDIRSSDHRDLESIRAAAGIQPMTLGSIVSTPKNERGVIPLAFSHFGACKRSFMVTSNATCRVRPSGIDQATIVLASSASNRRSKRTRHFGLIPQGRA